MAVNENLYSWMLKTYGMGAAEWYRSNPTKPSGANPFLPKGAYVPLAQKDAPGAKGPRGETLASVSPDIIEESIIEPAPKAPAETEDQKFERYYNQAKQQFAESQKGRPSLAPGEIAAYGQKNVYFDPTFGQYGGYVTKENLSFSPSSELYKRYEDAVKQIPIPTDPLIVGSYALKNKSIANSPGSLTAYTVFDDPDTLARAKVYEDALAARQKAFQDIYQTPLSQLPYKSYSEAQEQNVSLDDYRASLAKLGIEIPLTSAPGGYFVRGATPEDYEVQTYGAENVGREDYRQQRVNSAIAKNFEILQQQAESGNQDSQAFLDQYTAQEEAPAAPETGPRGEEVEPARGPRGENMGDIAAEYGAGFPKTPKWMLQLEKEYNKVKDKPFSPGTPKPGRGMADTWEGPVREAQAPAFDEQKALIAAQAAGSYRKRGDVEDPFRSGAVG